MRRVIDVGGGLSFLLGFAALFMLLAFLVVWVGMLVQFPLITIVVTLPFLWVVKKL